MKKIRNHDRSPDKQGFSVALPKVLLQQIEDIAKQESRSRNGQIEYFLGQAVEEWQPSRPGRRVVYSDRYTAATFNEDSPADKSRPSLASSDAATAAAVAAVKRQLRTKKEKRN